MDALRPMFQSITPGACRMYAALLYHQVIHDVISEATAASKLYALYRSEPDAETALGSEVICIDEWFENWAMGEFHAAIAVRRYLVRFQDVELPRECQPVLRRQDLKDI